RSQLLEVARTQRNRTTPRNAAGRIRDANERAAVARLEELENGRERFAQRALRDLDLFDDLSRSPRGRRLVCHDDDASATPVTGVGRLWNKCGKTYASIGTCPGAAATRSSHLCTAGKRSTSNSPSPATCV